MNKEIEAVLNYYNWYPSSNMMPRLSYIKSSSDIYFIPTANSGIFVEWKGKGHKPIVVCEHSDERECLINILKYSGKSYEDWMNVLINRNEQEIQRLISENKELEKRKSLYDM